MPDVTDDIPVEDPPVDYDAYYAAPPRAVGADRIWPAFAEYRPRVHPRERDVAGMITDLFGSNRRGNPNAKAAGEALGVSERTVQRWIKNGPPQRGQVNDLRASHEKWKKSPSGRKGIGPRREKRIRQEGGNICFSGWTLISSDRRHRDFEHSVSADACARILDALQQGDDVAAHRMIENALADRVGGSVELEIERLQVKPVKL